MSDEARTARLPVSVEDRGLGGLQMLVTAGAASFVADEDVALGGLDLGPNPHELVAAGLGACTTMTLRLYAQRKGWPLGRVDVSVTWERQAATTPPDRFHRRIVIGGALDAEQVTRLLEIAEKCPVHRLLTVGAAIDTAMTHDPAASGG